MGPHHAPADVPDVEKKRHPGIALFDRLLQPVGASVEVTGCQIVKRKPKRSAKGRSRKELVGIPLAVQVSAANVQDSKMMPATVDTPARPSAPGRAVQREIAAGATTPRTSASLIASLRFTRILV